MALDELTQVAIREHVGYVDDVGDDEPKEIQQFDTLENLYGVYGDVERVALHIWRVRLANHFVKAFDVAQEGNWLARSQKTRVLKSQVAKYESRVGGAGTQAVNQTIASGAEDQDDILTT